MSELEALRRACELARRGRFDVEPNPLVGCVLLREGEVVGEGWHAAYGGPHAEVAALASAGERARGATAVVTLEPCSTRGKTGPCTEALLAAGVARVVVGSSDPAPAHDGRGLSQLRAAGVDVVGPADLAGLDADGAADVAAVRAESEALIERFRGALGVARPHVVAKWAMSRDGAIAAADGEPVQLTGRPASRLVHAWRASLDAILVGVGTVLSDDPRLTPRGEVPVLRPLRRVVLDPRLRTPTASVLATTTDEAPTWVCAADPVDEDRAAALEEHGVRVVRLPAGPRWLADVFASLHLDGVRRALVEGGATTLTRLLAADLVDQLAVFLAPTELGPGAVPALRDRSLAGLSPEALGQALQLHDVSVATVGDDVLVRGFRRSR